MYGVFCSPSVEESHLSEAGLVTDNSHFVALPQSHSSEFDPLGWWWCTWPAWPAQPHRDDSPLSEQWGKVNFGGALLGIQSAGFSQGRKECLLQLGTPLHIVLPSTDHSPFSSPCSPCRHWLWPRPSHLPPVKQH